MRDFLDVINTLIDYLSQIFIDLIDFFTLGVRSSDFLTDLLAYIPDYFYIGIAPFIALFVILLFTDRG